MRQAAERGAGAVGSGAAALMAPLLQNLCLSLGDNEEACFCLKAWQGLPASVRTGGRPGREEALRAVAVVNRVRRLLSGISGARARALRASAATMTVMPRPARAGASTPTPHPPTPPPTPHPRPAQT